MRFSFHHLIKTRIKEADDDSVFTINDFTDIADDKTVSKTLTRLEKSGHIKKLLRGNMLSRDLFTRKLLRQRDTNPMDDKWRWSV